MKIRIPPPLHALIAAAMIWGLSRLAPDLAFRFPGQAHLASIIAGLGLAQMFRPRRSA